VARGVCARPCYRPTVVEAYCNWMCRMCSIKVRPGGPRSPRHRMPFNLNHEFSTCVTMTWLATFGRPYMKDAPQWAVHNKYIHTGEALPLPPLSFLQFPLKLSVALPLKPLAVIPLHPSKTPALS